ncbi:TonB-dependent receptor [Saccharicrinis carchari]|nr:TonB-dependent receptor [Saccharicrinis carchari]
MKLSALMLLFFGLTLTAETTDAQQRLRNISLENATILDVFRAIEAQSDFGFFFKDNQMDLEKHYSLNLEDASLEEALAKVFADGEYNYQIIGDNVVVMRNDADSTSSITLSHLQQDGRTVSGTIRDANGEPIPGASIVVKGTTTGTISDMDGNFTLSGVPEDATLQFSFVGMNTVEASVTNQNTFDIVLQEESLGLDEVIVVGYGTTSTRMTVGSVTSLQTDKIDELPFTNTGDALQGRTAGVVIQSGGGAPGSKPRISIRGGEKPLYVIDGVIRDESDFNSLNSSDIDKISILKDASATAVYGSRAGDGIVLVQTKRGQAGDIKIQYSGGVDFSQPAVFPDKINALDYVNAANQAAAYDGRDPIYSQDEINKIANNSDPYGSITANTDWRDLALNDFASGHRHNLSMSGVSDNGINYYAAVGYLKQNSIFKQSHNNEYDRANLRSNISTRFDDIGLEVGINIDGALENRNPTVWGDYTVWSQIQNVKPNYAAFNPDGTYSSISIHPLVILDERAGYNDEKDKYVNTQLNANWDVPSLPGLKVGALANVRYSDYNQKIFQSKAPQYQPNGDAVPYTSNYLRMTNDHSTQTSFDANLMYKKSIDRHSFELQGVYSFFRSNGENFWAQREKYLSSSFDQLFAGDASTQTNYGAGRESARIGYVGRVKYDFDRKYMFEGNFRVDKSDNFAPGERTGFFPSGAVAWTISEESFMQDLKDNGIIDFLKVRTSYGIVGLEAGARFGYLPVYEMDPQALVVDGNFQTGFSEGPLVSNDLSWYEREVLDIGFDAAFLRNKLTATFDYYYYRTQGYLISPQNQYTTPLGKDLPLVKSESAHRRAGYELSLRWEDTVGELKYEVGANFTSYDELWEKKEDETMSDLMDPNKRITHTKNYYGRAYKTNGLYQSIDQILTNPRRETANELKPGDLFFQDANGDGKIDGEDFRRIGKPTFPSFSYGIDFSLEYKNIFMNGLFQGTGKRYMQLNEFMRGSNTEYMTYDFQKDYWRTDNTNAAFPRLSTYQNLNAGQNYTVAADFWYHNASYLRLKSLQVGYDFKDVVKNLNGISAMRLSLSGTNLFTISDVTKYFDPEIISDAGYAYPIQRTYSVSLNVTF